MVLRRWTATERGKCGFCGITLRTSDDPNRVGYLDCDFNALGFCSPEHQRLSRLYRDDIDRVIKMAVDFERQRIIKIIMSGLANLDCTLASIRNNDDA